MVGRRQLFIRTGACHLRCRYCDTPDSLERRPSFRVRAANGSPSRSVENPVVASDVEALVKELLAHEGVVDGTSLTGGEPLLQAEFLSELLQGGMVPRPRLLETSGTQPDRLRTLLPWIDIVSMDIKLPSNTAEPAFWEQHREFLGIARGKVYVKVLVDAGTDSTDVELAARLVASTASETTLFLQPIVSSDGGIDMNESQLNGFFQVGRRYLEDIRVLPQIHKILALP